MRSHNLSRLDTVKKHDADITTCQHLQDEGGISPTRPGLLDVWPQEGPLPKRHDTVKAYAAVDHNEGSKIGFTPASAAPEHLYKNTIYDKDAKKQHPQGEPVPPHFLQRWEALSLQKKQNQMYKYNEQLGRDFYKEDDSQKAQGIAPRSQLEAVKEHTSPMSENSFRPGNDSRATTYSTKASTWNSTTTSSAAPTRVFSEKRALSSDVPGQKPGPKSAEEDGCGCVIL